MKKIIIGSRGSDLALWQAYFTKDKLETLGHQVEIKIIKTKGDQIQHLSFDKIEGKGFFTKELEDALMNKEIDLAVHSFKDVPTEPVEGLVIAGNSYREDPADIMLIRKENTDFEQLFNIKKGLVVGTSSARRKAQLLAFRPDLSVKDIRGNVPTRIDKLRKGDFDAIILAKAGVKRIKVDLSEFETYVFNVRQFIPAPAQGVLAFQTREDDEELKEIINLISDSDVAETNAVERKILNLFEGGCHMPVGAYCIKEHDEFLVWASKADSWNTIPTRVFKRAKLPGGLAETIIKRIVHPISKKVFISRDLNDNSYFKKTLEAAGSTVEGRSLVDFEAAHFPALPPADWIFFSSKNGVKYFLEQQKIPKNLKIAAIGEGTAAALSDHNVKVDFVGDIDDTAAIAQKFGKIAAGATVIFPQARQSMRTVQEQVGDQINAVDLVVYENKPASAKGLPEADVLVFTSPLNVRAYFKDNHIKKGQEIVVIGTTTAKAVEEAGVKEYHLSYAPDEVALADTVMGV